MKFSIIDFFTIYRAQSGKSIIIWLNGQIVEMSRSAFFRFRGEFSCENQSYISSNGYVFKTQTKKV